VVQKLGLIIPPPDDANTSCQFVGEMPPVIILSAMDRGPVGPFYTDNRVGFYVPDRDPTPEPASFFLMGIGLLVIGVILRRHSIRT
jgi:hypothetical protein